MPLHNCRSFAALVALICLPVSVSATVVRFDIAFGAQPAGAVYVDLFEAEAPLTVANFLNYVEDGSSNRRYSGTFLHRNVTDFVVQGGGYRYEPELGPFNPDSVFEIDADPPVVNEFDLLRSNIRGTIAMAKVGGDPDSATSQWFFNLSDNSANLDNQNGGFTVFGRVLANGMDLVDAIGALSTVNLGGAFTSLPVPDQTQPVDETNLVVLSRVVVDPPATVAADRLEVDFGFIEVNGTPGVETVTIQNVGSQDLILGELGDGDPLAAPFGFVAGQDSCSGQTLGPVATCSLQLESAPVGVGDLLDSFNVPSSDLAQPDLIIAVRGVAVASSPTLNVQPLVLDFGDIGAGEPVDMDLTITNFGGGQLEPLDVFVSSVGTSVFSVVENGCDQAVLGIGESCLAKVRAQSFGLGAFQADVEFVADPGAQTVKVPLMANTVALEPRISFPGSVVVSDTRFNEPVSTTISLSNVGVDDPLYLSQVEIVGGDALLFSVTEACVGVALLAQGAPCIERLNFSPVETGDFSTVVRVYTNDPANPVVSIPVVATASQDDDGISDAIERAGPNGGDGNGDGIADHLQENVASLPNENGAYVSIEVSAGNLQNVQSPGRGTLVDVPTLSSGGGLAFNDGFYAFNIENVPLNGNGGGGGSVVTLYLPAGTSANRYFKFGRIPGESVVFTPQHWYVFPEYDPGVGFGVEFAENKVVLHLIDGGYGDNDLAANGVINDPGGPASLAIYAGGGGGGGGCALLLRPTSPVLDLLLLFFGVLVWRLWCALLNRGCVV